ncbi:MAG: heterodisulfide reductase subunit C [Actinobacteria bacterium]|nr:heterodisulfide reductase subunit C [Actinomycetota bacterium]
MEKQHQNYLTAIRDEIVKEIDPGIYNCYQCGRCTAGCPLADVYEYQPNEIIRLVQLNRIDAILNSNSVYLCASCEICSSRCPQEVKVSAIMNHLRIKSWQNRSFKLKESLNFYRIFLGIVEKLGRSFEPALILILNLLNGRFFNDMDLVPGILIRRKIKLVPELTRQRKEVSAIIKKYL